MDSKPQNEKATTAIKESAEAAPASSLLAPQVTRIVIPSIYLIQLLHPSANTLGVHTPRVCSNPFPVDVSKLLIRTGAHVTYPSKGS